MLWKEGFDSLARSCSESKTEEGGWGKVRGSDMMVSMHISIPYGIMVITLESGKVKYPMK